jgi:hypothetical protein
MEDDNVGGRLPALAARGLIGRLEIGSKTLCRAVGHITGKAALSGHREAPDNVAVSYYPFQFVGAEPDRFIVRAERVHSSTQSGPGGLNL